MNIDYFKEFERAKKLGLKAEAKSNIDLFIESFTSSDDKIEWVKSYLEMGEYGHKIRYELYGSIIFPVLLDGFRNNDTWSYFWLAETIQNIYDSKKLHEKIEFLTDFDLLKMCFTADPGNQKVCLALIEQLVKSFDYAIHEWPVGVIYAPDESPEDFLEQIDYARVLDKENKHSDFFSEVENIVKEDKDRLTKYRL